MWDLSKQLLSSFRITLTTIAAGTGGRAAAPGNCDNRTSLWPRLTRTHWLSVAGGTRVMVVRPAATGIRECSEPGMIIPRTPSH